MRPTALTRLLSRILSKIEAQSGWERYWAAGLLDPKSSVVQFMPPLPVPMQLVVDNWAAIRSAIMWLSPSTC
jgi:hypothetical protein